MQDRCAHVDVAETSDSSEGALRAHGEPNGKRQRGAQDPLSKVYWRTSMKYMCRPRVNVKEISPHLSSCHTRLTN